MQKLCEAGDSKVAMYHDLSTGSMVQANQFVIVKNKDGMLLDPGGHKIYPKLFADLSTVVNVAHLKYIFFSHQDPDIVAATNGWLMVTEAEAYLSSLWMRFITHFGVDELVVSRIHPIPDAGMSITLGGEKLKILPAHFMHSPGNFHVYDPQFKILFSGDLGASVGCPYTIVEDFDAHIQYMEGFHKRYIPANKALKLWANMARKLDIEILAPQHGAVFTKKEHVQKFIDWVDGLSVGLDNIDEFKIPE